MIVRGFTTAGTGEKLTPFPCGPGGSGTDTDDQPAAEVPYDNSGSGLTADDVQEAIDELAAQVAACCDAGQFSDGDLLSTGEVGGGSGDLVLISEVETTGSQADVTFSSIPATYRDLEIRIRGRGTASATEVGIWVQFNGDTGNNYSASLGVENGSTVTTAQNLATSAIKRLFDIPAANATASYQGVGTIVIGNYRGTTFFKPAYGIAGVPKGSASTNVLGEFSGGAWASTNAINSVKVLLSTGNFVDGSFVSLYGRH